MVGPISARQCFIKPVCAGAVSARHFEGACVLQENRRQVSGEPHAGGGLRMGCPKKAERSNLQWRMAALSFRMIRGVVREMDLCAGNDTRRPPGGADMHDDARQRRIEGRFLQESY